ncbi:VOC family protein [Bacillus cereus]|uniref:SMU1112c/YaeR family gloxylase I-like metalloprotein n=1 Tax=Bacillus cereus TaxID=1396 RepID=UPI00356F54A9
MIISKVHHIAIICSDYKTSKYFYTKILGFKVINEVYRAERDSYKLDLCVGEQYQIELFSFPNPPKRPSFPEAAGLRHLAFAVTDIQEAVRHLHQCGIDTEPIRVDEITGRRFVFFQDPDCLPLELYED